jgi:hypothetical protein
MFNAAARNGIKETINLSDPLVIRGSEKMSDNAAKIEIDTIEFDSSNSALPIILKGKYLDVKDGSATMALEFRIHSKSEESTLELEQPRNVYHDGILFYLISFHFLP